MDFLRYWTSHFGKNLFAPRGYPSSHRSGEQSKNTGKELPCWTASWLYASVIVSVSVALTTKHLLTGKSQFPLWKSAYLMIQGVKSTTTPHLSDTVLHWNPALLGNGLYEGEHLRTCYSAHMSPLTYWIHKYARWMWAVWVVSHWSASFSRMYDKGSFRSEHVLFTGQTGEAPWRWERPWSITEGWTQQLLGCQ